MIDVRWFTDKNLPLTIACQIESLDLPKSGLLVKAFYDQQQFIEAAIYDTDGRYFTTTCPPPTVDSTEDIEVYDYDTSDTDSLKETTFKQHPDATLHVITTEGHTKTIRDEVFRSSELEYTVNYEYDRHDRVIQQIHTDSRGYTRTKRMWAPAAQKLQYSTHIPTPILTSTYYESQLAEIYPEERADYFSAIARSYDLSGAPDEDIRNFFDDEGRLIRRWFYRNGPKGMKYLMECSIKYPNDLLRTENTFNSDGELIAKIILNTDDAARPLLKLTEDKSSNQLRRTWVYDDNERTCTKRCFYNGRPMSTDTTRFNKMGLPSEIRHIGPDEANSLTCHLEYDSENRLILCRHRGTEGTNESQ